MIYSATNHWVEARDTIWRHSAVIYDGLTSFFSSQQRVHVNMSATVKTVGGDFFMRWRKAGRI